MEKKELKESAERGKKHKFSFKKQHEDKGGSSRHKALVEGREEGREEEKKYCEECEMKHKKGEHKK